MCRSTSSIALIVIIFTTSRPASSEVFSRKYISEQDPPCSCARYGTELLMAYLVNILLKYTCMKLLMLEVESMQTLQPNTYLTSNL